jgi:PilZ domain
MEEETSAGAAYLAALKGSKGEQAAAPARAPDTASLAKTKNSKFLAPNVALPSRKEKRRSPRYRCHGSAHLRDIKTGVATWATFTDVSVHGCYVEMSATYRVGTEIALTIEVNGVKVETIGEVRVAYPGLGMGIAFTETTEENREQLLALVSSVSQSTRILGAQVLTRSVPTPSPAPLPLPSMPDPEAALEAIMEFFQNREVLGRDEFLAILRKSETARR